MLEKRIELDEYLGLAFDRIPVAMIVVDGQGSITRLNRLAEATFGYGPGELPGRPIEALVPHRYRDAHPHLRQGFLSETQQARPMGGGRDLKALRKDGTEFPVEIGINPVETEAGPMVLCVIVDLTERKQNEKRVKDALRQKDLLLREVHHRVKNNLQIIHSLLDLQALQCKDESLIGMLRESQNRIRSMALIHQTLYQSHDLAQVDFGHFLNRLLSRLTEIYASPSRTISVHIDAHGVRLPINEAIPCGLIVNELASNALKHAFEDRSAGTISVDLREDADRWVELKVSDDGAGIPDDLDLLQTGSLGMQLVSLLARQLRGQLDIQRSSPARFSLRFQLDKAP
jgi:PAS domain S-box-containing protein